MNTVDFKENINLFLRTTALYIAIGVAVLILIAILLIVLLSKKKKKISKQDAIIDANEWLNALGGKENIIEKSATGSRLVLKLDDVNKIDEAKLKELGVTNILKMSNKITLVFEDQAEAVLNQLN